MGEGVRKMDKVTARSLAENFLADHPEFRSSELLRYLMSWGYRVATAQRILYVLRKGGLIELVEEPDGRRPGLYRVVRR